MESGGDWMEQMIRTIEGADSQVGFLMKANNYKGETVSAAQAVVKASVAIINANAGNIKPHELLDQLSDLTSTEIINVDMKKLFTGMRESRSGAIDNSDENSDETKYYIRVVRSPILKKFGAEPDDVNRFMLDYTRFLKISEESQKK